MREESRRNVLQATAGLAAGSVLTGRVVGSDDESAPHDVVPTTPAEIREAFADIPRLESPTERERWRARHNFPEVVVPDEGPAPDPAMQTPVELDAEPWLLASVYDHASRRGDSERQRVEDLFLSRRQAVEEWVLPDGTDAVDVVLEALRRDR